MGFFKRHIAVMAALVFIIIFFAGPGAADDMDAFARKRDRGDSVYDGQSKPEPPSGPARAAAYYYFTVAQLMIYEQDFAKAIKYYEKAIKRDSTSPVLYTDLAHLHIRMRENDEALRYLDKATELDPDYYRALVLSGELLTVLKKEDKAIEVFLKAIEVDPDGQRPYMLLSTIYVNRGDNDLAIKTFKSLIEVKPASTVSYYYMGRIEADRFNYIQAIEYLKKVLELNPTFAAGYLELGLIYERLKDVDNAIGIYEEGIEVAPYDINLRNRLGQLFIQQNQLDRAIEHFEVVSENGRARLNAVLKIGMIYFELKRFDDSLEWFKKALAVDPDSTLARYYLGAAYEEKKDLVKAAAEYEMLPRGDENYADAKIRLSFIYEGQKSYDEAIDAMSDAIDSRGGDPTLYKLLIGLYRDAGRLTRSKEVAEKSVKIFPDDADLRFTLGALCDEMEGGLDCLTHMYKAVEMDPAHASALNYIGYTYVENGIKLNEAEVLINRALAVSPGSGHIMDSLGWLYYVKGDVDRAVAELEKAFDKLPNDATVAEHLGDAYVKQADRQKAFGIYEKAHKLAPKNRKIERKLERLRIQLSR
ncbi:MAG: tetratricopeptide repeat protein [Thermodesulfobacteriota bacterium]